MPKRSLTLNACTTCRKKRTKCDGRLPCSRCKLRREKCHYEDKEWQTKEHLRSEVKRLKRENQDTHTILRALLTPHQQAVLQRLGTDEPIDSIAQSFSDRTARGGGAHGLESNAYPRRPQQEAFEDEDEDEDDQDPGGIHQSQQHEQQQQPHHQPHQQQQQQQQHRRQRRQQRHNSLIDPLTPPNDDNVAIRPWPPTSLTPPASLSSPVASSRLPPATSGLHLASMTNLAPFPSDFHASANATTYLGERTAPGSSNSVVSDFAPSLLYTPNPADTNLSPQNFDDGASLSFDGTVDNDAGGSGSSSPWTRVTTDGSFVDQLLDLFFAWEVAPFSMVCKDLFLRDYYGASSAAGGGRSRDGDRSLYCSPALVSAIMSLASRYLVDGDGPAGPFSEPLLAASAAWGDRFFHESRSLLSAETLQATLCLPSIQALGLLALREMCCGRETAAKYLVVKALEGITATTDGPKAQLQEENEYYNAKYATLSGIVSLARITHLVGTQPCPSPTYSPPSWKIYQRQSASPEYGLDSKLASAVDILASHGRRQSGAGSCGNLILDLTELVHSMVPRLQSQNSSDVSMLYQKCLNWYASASGSLKESGRPSPSILFTHIYFHFCLLILFRPLVDVSPSATADQDAATLLCPRTICAEAVRTILGLIQSYAHLFTLRRTPCLVPYFVFAATATQIALGLPDGGSASNSSTPGPFSASPSSPTASCSAAAAVAAQASQAYTGMFAGRPWPFEGEASIGAVSAPDPDCAYTYSLPLGLLANSNVSSPGGGTSSGPVLYDMRSGESALTANA